MQQKSFPIAPLAHDYQKVPQYFRLGWTLNRTARKIYDKVNSYSEKHEKMSKRWGWRETVNFYYLPDNQITV